MRLVIELSEKTKTGVVVALLHEGAKQATAKEKQLAGLLVEVIKDAVPRVAELLGRDAVAMAANPGKLKDGEAKFYVDQTKSGRYAVLERGEEVKLLGCFESEGAALTIAAALNSGSVKTVDGAGRWNN